jgi:lysophospholipase L1-like esterase
LTGVDVETDRGTTLIAIGDSITDGNAIAPKALGRSIGWSELMGTQLCTRPSMRDLSVVNMGIGGNRLLHDGTGPSILARLDRDVLAVPGVSSVILLIGINDLLRMEWAVYPEPVSKDAMIVALEQVIVRAHDRGIKVVGGTILAATRAHSKRSEEMRREINDWIRSSGKFDAVIDFEAVTRDPAAPDKLNAKFDLGDGLHPNFAGYGAMASAAANVIEQMNR